MVINSIPSTYSASNKPQLFDISISGLYVIVELFHGEDDEEKVYNGKFYPTPENPDKVIFNLYPILANLPSFTIDNEEILIKNRKKNVFPYYLKIKEYSANGTLLDTQTTNTLKVIKTTMDKSLMVTHDYADYLIPTIPSTKKFLTHPYTPKTLFKDEFRHLYFLQSGNTTVNIVVAKSPSNRYEVPFTGECACLLVSPAIPGTKAQATITINTPIVVGDNVTILIDGTPLFNYTIPSDHNENMVANDIKNLFILNGFHSTIVGNVITVTAPNVGESGNDIIIGKQIFNEETIGTTLTGTVRASTVISNIEHTIGNRLVYVNVQDLNIPNLNLFTSSISESNGTNFIQFVVDGINGNSGAHGYNANFISSSSFEILAPLTYGSQMNGQFAEYYDDFNQFIYNPFSNGESEGGEDTITHSIIPMDITPFTGGEDEVPAEYAYQMTDMYRLNISPSFLESNFNTTFTQFTIYLKNEANEIISESITYNVVDPCHKDYFSVQYNNSIGGMDTLIFVNPISTINYEKGYVKNKRNEIITNGVYTKEKINIFSTPTQTIKAWSLPMEENQNILFHELVNSTEVNIAKDGKLIPTIVQEKTIELLKKRINADGLIQYQLTFEVPENLIIIQ